MNHEADIEFSRVTTSTDIGVTDCHRNNVKMYVITICTQCIMPHVMGAHTVPPQQTIPIQCWCCVNNMHCCPY